LRSRFLKNFGVKGNARIEKSLGVHFIGGLRNQDIRDFLTLPEMGCRLLGFTLVAVGGPIYLVWPVIFVNACDAADISPLSFYLFRDEFRKRQSGQAGGFCIPYLCR
jgi:hypothetical protein